jgi:PIN domain nuclease of toxin-antitoxin system
VGGEPLTLLLDTHVLLWWLLDNGQLSAAQTQALERAEASGDRVALASISLWEVAKLIERGRIELRQAPDGLFEDIEAHPRIALLPLTGRIALESTRLGQTFHKDPVDQILTATARVHGLHLVTADERIRQSRVVPVI